jgi:prepilin-type N-terminal cleavage/methylation domain-containing protein
MKNKLGLSLIELMVAIAIIAILATIVVPNLQRQRAVQERRDFLNKLNALTQLGWRQAITTGKVHRLSFDMKNNTISLAVALDKKDEKGNVQFEPARSYQLKPVFTWPRNLEIKNFFIEGVDEMGRYVGRATEETWFYMMPEGLTQAVIINMVEAEDKQGKRREIGLVLNPFSGQFKEYDAFQKP